MGRFWIACCLFLLSACERPFSGDASVLSIQIPDQGALSKSLESLNALPANRKTCFAVNITGPGIPNKNPSCGPQSGILAGFAEPGQVIEASVPRGENRKIELYLYLLPEGKNSACPKFQENLTAQQLTNSYLVATRSGLLMNAPNVNVEMKMQFPGLSQHLAQHLALSSACTASNQEVPTGIGFNSGKVHGTSGGGYRFSYRIGETIDPTGSSAQNGYKMKARNRRIQ